MIMKFFFLLSFNNPWWKEIICFFFFYYLCNAITRLLKTSRQIQSLVKLVLKKFLRLSSDLPHQVKIVSQTNRRKSLLYFMYVLCIKNFHAKRVASLFIRKCVRVRVRIQHPRVPAEIYCAESVFIFSRMKKHRIWRAFFCVVIIFSTCTNCAE